MKKTSKSIAALFVALMVVMSFMVPAFAASTPTAGATSFKPTNTSTATVNVATGNANDTLYMYKVVDAQFNPTVESNNLVKTFTTLFQAFLTAKGNPLTVAGYAALENDSAALKLLLGDFTAYVKTNSSATPYSATTNAAGKAVFTNIPMGQYIVVGGGNTNGAFIYQTVTAEVLPHIEGLEYKLYPSYDVAMKQKKQTLQKRSQAAQPQTALIPQFLLAMLFPTNSKLQFLFIPRAQPTKHSSLAMLWRQVSNSMLTLLL